MNLHRMNNIPPVHVILFWTGIPLYVRDHLEETKYFSILNAVLNLLKLLLTMMIMTMIFLLFYLNNSVGLIILMFGLLHILLEN